MTKWRGSNSATPSSADDVKRLVDSGANLMRYQLITYWDDAARMNENQYTSWIMDELDKLDQFIPLCKTKLKILIDLHTPPGGKDANDRYVLFRQAWAKNTFLSIWEQIALRYKNEDTVIAYGVLNEPAGAPEKIRALMQEMINEIRIVDTQKRISVTWPYSDPMRYKDFMTFTGSHLWYEAHMYLPLPMSHQGLYGYTAPRHYPNKHTNKLKLKEFLLPLKTFQTTYNLKILIGEFGICTYAPEQTRINYLTDLIDIFEDYNFNWLYHSWGKNQVWDAESYPNVLKVLTDNFTKNT